MEPEVTYLELSEETGTSHKFYEVTVTGSEVRIRYGRIGDSGQVQSKTYPTPEKAQGEASKKIKEKIKKGYEPAVQGVRQRRSITRRSVVSTASTVRQRSPLLWQFKSGSPAFGIFVDGDGCWMGNQSGQVFKLDHQGQVLNQYKLPEGVKCLVGDDSWIYAGCDDGNVYDLTGKLPRLAYTIDESVDILWLDIWDGLLGVSDANGGMTKINPEGEVEWTRLSGGRTGWMVRVDAQGFYHGHGAGVTLYDREEGRQLWHQPTDGAVLFGWQESDRVYAGTSAKLFYTLNKADGAEQHRARCDASVFSCATAAGGEWLFAGDSSSSLYCFDATGQRIWKLATGCGSALSMQFWSDGAGGDRLFIVTTDGSLACVDVSAAAIAAAQEGTVPTPKAIALSPQAPAPTLPSATLETTTDASQGILVECFREGGQLRVRVLSPGYNSTWKVQFPRDIREEGAKYLVQEVREARQGGFYRAYGDIRRLQS